MVMISLQELDALLQDGLQAGMAPLVILNKIKNAEAALHTPGDVINWGLLRQRAIERGLPL